MQRQMSDRISFNSSDDSLEAPAPRAVRQVIAVGGGRGGVGKSTVAVNLAVYLAQLGRTVVLVDADPAGAELHAVLDVALGLAQELGDDAGRLELRTWPTSVPGLLLMPQLYTPGSTIPVRPGRRAQWSRSLRHLAADHVIVDLGAGTAPPTLDLFLSSDLGICLTSPEPPSVESTYRFVRALFIRRLRRLLVKDRFKLRLVERAHAELPAMPSPLDVVRSLARYDTTLAESAAIELGRLRPRLVVNEIRVRADSDLGPEMCDMSKRYLGVDLDYVGHIEQDDSIRLSVVRKRPVLIDSPTSKSARNIERIARRVLALLATRDPVRNNGARLSVAGQTNLYDMLGTHRGATDEELRRAFKRQISIFQPGGLALTSLLTDEQRLREVAVIEEAHETLLDPMRRRSYDASTFPDDEEERIRDTGQEDSAAVAERQMLREQLAREITAETVYTGSLLAKVRESLGIEVDDIAQRTKISTAYLRALEGEDFRSLPALVYTRGFLQQLAKCLDLDPAQVTRTYLRRMRGADESTKGSGGS